ncbi:hypothetical protein D3C87_1591780 [compost metagenome]
MFDLWQSAAQEFSFWPDVGRKELMAKITEQEIGFAFDCEVGDLADLLSFRFVGDFRSAENDFDLRRNAFKNRNDF